MSDPLTPEQQDWYEQRFGQRYVAVPEISTLAVNDRGKVGVKFNRAERRRRKYRPGTRKYLGI